MEYIIDTDKITLDFDEDRKTKDLYEYRLTVFDSNCHYSDEIHLKAEHLQDLLKGLNDNKDLIKCDDFD